jgi:hypothetical protein
VRSRRTANLYLTAIDTGEIHDISLPEDLRAGIWIVKWFPDGENLLLATLSREHRHEAWVKSIFSGAPRKLPSSLREPAISPQGSEIAAISEDGSEIRVMGANGENPRKVLTNDDGVFSAVS